MAERLLRFTAFIKGVIVGVIAGGVVVGVAAGVVVVFSSAGLGVLTVAVNSLLGAVGCLLGAEVAFEVGVDFRFLIFAIKAL